MTATAVVAIQEVLRKMQSISVEMKYMSMALYL